MAVWERGNMECGRKAYGRGACYEQCAQVESELELTLSLNSPPFTPLARLATSGRPYAIIDNSRIAVLRARLCNSNRHMLDYSAAEQNPIVAEKPHKSLAA